MKRNREEEKEEEKNKKKMEIVWQNPTYPAQKEDYIFHNGKRHVRPYYFEFVSHVNKRWEGKTIVDLFAQEFRGRSKDYYVSAVKCGRIQVDGENIPVSYIVKRCQKISHFLHRHEPPVMAWNVAILQNEPDVLTVCKPASVPVHPCGQYRKNTVLGILQAEHGLAPLYPIHRLDRLVSGLLIMTKNPARADIFRQHIEAGLVQKQYVAKVVGVFPEGEIRVHLQYTGHPIANDMLYLSVNVVGRSTLGTTADRAAALSGSSPATSCENHNEEYKYCNQDLTIDPMCTHCPNLAPNGYDEHEEGLWLHCVRYSGPEWVYECPYPDWASLS
ncbi:RNA pseudouridine synthase 7-like isoform X3 [Durio zibethinus]|uniref:RNA pseudouridine synthase 7-like isoform X3 n=1 Tax=Durio zibethinus TaxID=66656 RepID=A0A6P6B0Z1_DURZI|nr:RNA pseudouridine synthase 7-like isoform X3 [Durio zibethinus]